MKKSPLVVLFFTIFLDLLGFGLIIPILPNLVKHELGNTDIMVGIAASVYSLMQFLFGSFWGSLSDRIGRRPVLLISTSITCVSYLIFSFSNHIWILLISRSMAGFGAGNISAATAYISDITTPENRAKRMGMIGAAFGLGFIFGPPIGSWLKETFHSIAPIGFFAAGLCFINIIMTYVLLPESLKTKNTSGDKSLKQTFVDIWIFLNKKIIGSLMILNFVFISAFTLMQITAALMWKEHFGFGEFEIGKTFAFIGIVSAIVQGGLIGILIKKFSEKKLLIMGLVLLAIGLGGMPFVPKDVFIIELILLALIALANGCIMPVIGTVLSKNALVTEQGKVMGINQAIGSLGRVLGPLLGSFLYALHFTLPYIVAAAISIAIISLTSRIFVNPVSNH